MQLLEIPKCMHAAAWQSQLENLQLDPSQMCFNAFVLVKNLALVLTWSADAIRTDLQLPSDAAHAVRRAALIEPEGAQRGGSLQVASNMTKAQ